MPQAKRIALSRKPLVPTPEDTQQSARILETVFSTPVSELAIEIRDQSGAFRTVALPGRAAHFLLAALSQFADGHAIRLLQIRRELTTREAAEILNVSRTYLIRLLERGEIPHRLVGSHRRISLTDLLAYKEKTDPLRQQTLDAIAAEAQELKLYE
jgi:excisionase family DNA binding protein